MIDVHIVGEYEYIMRSQLKWILIYCECSVPSFIFTMYTDGKNKFDCRRPPLETPEPICNSSPTNRKKVATDDTFSKSEVSQKYDLHIISKVDAIKTNKYCVYAFKKQKLEYGNFIKTIHAPLEKLLDNHKFVDNCACVNIYI